MTAVDIYEVGPRDGFQNIATYIPLQIKLSVIDDLVAAGLEHIQATSFVSPKAIPQMKDAREVAAHCLDRYPEVDFFALAPNAKGAQAAYEAGLRKVAYVISLSPSHNQANIRRTHEQSLDDLREIRSSFPDLDVGLDLATAFACPFEGRSRPEQVLAFLEPVAGLGIKTVNLCDTIGLANPRQVRETIRAVRAHYPELNLQIHVHDTRNMGMVNTLAAIEEGVTQVQSTSGGLGGCPFAPGASGNLATEDLAFMLQEMGYELNVDVSRLKAVAQRLKQLIPGGVFSGHLVNIQADSPELDGCL